METKEREITGLEAKQPSPSGYGSSWTEVRYAQVGERAVVYRFVSDAVKRLRTGRRAGMDFRHWFAVYGWKATEPYKNRNGESAVMVSPIADEAKLLVEAAIREKEHGSTSTICYPDSESRPI